MSLYRNSNESPAPQPHGGGDGEPARRITILRARDLMERGVRTVEPETTIARLVEVFDEEGVSGLPVIDSKDKLVGVVTKTDMARAYAEAAEEGEPRPDGTLYDLEDEEALELEPDLRRFEKLALTARALMTTNVVTAGEDETAADLAARMLEHGIHRVIVTRRDEVIGVVSSFDLLRAIVEYESQLKN